MFDVVLVAGVSIFATRPNGPYRIATELRRGGYSVKVIDFVPHTPKDFLSQALSKCISDRTLWVGFSSTFLGTKLPLDEETVLRLRQSFPRLKLVFGGAFSYEKIPSIDYYIEGYADTTAVQLTHFLAGKGAMSFDRTRIDYRVTHDRKASSFDFANHGDVEYAPEDLVDYGEPLTMELSRGCIFSCRFCAYPLNGKRKNDHLKSPQLIDRELRENYDKYGTTIYTFVDDTFNDSTDKLREMVRVVEKLPFQLRFASYCRLDLIGAHLEQVDLLKDLGLTSVFFGIESLNHPSASAIGKGLNPQRALDLLWMLRDRWSETFISGGFIVGLPHDTEETLHGWLQSLVDENPFDSAYIVPLHLRSSPNKIWKSEFEKVPAKFGYVLNDSQDWSNTLTGLNFNRAKELADHYMKQRHDSLGPFIVPRALAAGLTYKELKSDRALSVIRAYQSRFINTYVQKTLNTA